MILLEIVTTYQQDSIIRKSYSVYGTNEWSCYCYASPKYVGALSIRDKDTSVGLAISKTLLILGQI
jgi:hypothetical protein